MTDLNPPTLHSHWKTTLTALPSKFTDSNGWCESYTMEIFQYFQPGTSEVVTRDVECDWPNCTIALSQTAYIDSIISCSSWKMVSRSKHPWK